MRNQTIFSRTLLVIIVTLMFNSCRKEPRPGPGPRPEQNWLLNFVGLTYDYYDAPDIIVEHEAQVHYFHYNEFKKPWLHTATNQTFRYLMYERRRDSFFYDNRQRLTEIRTTLFVRDIQADTIAPRKKEFRYDQFNRKSASLKFIFDRAMNQYRLTDSAVYAYQDTVITRTTYHFAVTSASKAVAAAVTSETDIFLYNRKGNLVKKIRRDDISRQYFQRIYGDYGDYDDAPNPYRLLNLEGLELEPTDADEGPKLYLDFWIAMDMPKFSKNNYHMTTYPDGPQLNRFRVIQNLEDSLVHSITRSVGGLGLTEHHQDFRYIPYN